MFVDYEFADMTCLAWSAGVLVALYLFLILIATVAKLCA
jgi:hypothetical protein